MKNLRLLTVSTLLLAGSFVTFTSCGGGEKSDETTEEKKEAKSGASEVAKVLQDLESGKIVLGETSASEIAKLYSLEEDEFEMTAEQEFTGYRLESNYGVDDDAVYYMSFHTYSEGDDYDPIKQEVKDIVAEMTKVLGTPDVNEDSYYEWEKADYTITLNTYSTSGYDINIDKVDEGFGDDICVGDIFTLKSDLADVFLVNIKNGKIKLGKTTKSEMEAIAGNGDSFDEEYDGLSVSGKFTYDGNVISKISLDYYYDCEGALDYLDIDKESITDLIDTELGVTGEADGNGASWSINGVSVTQFNFSDGYGVYFE
ncbi:MAG: hypothetical protein H6600_04895 [Flavobacteriales bacterium]|nr:hypothetical protein [Flavobacteriales bacterium]MCB9197774.1 hypothetical protein [Flavobacteriales bacterium]